MRGPGAGRVAGLSWECAPPGGVGAVPDTLRRSEPWQTSLIRCSSGGAVTAAPGGGTRMWREKDICLLGYLICALHGSFIYLGDGSCLIKSRFGGLEGVLARGFGARRLQYEAFHLSVYQNG